MPFSKSFQIQEIQRTDWPQIEEIYAQGIATRNATFESTTPTAEHWFDVHLDVGMIKAVNEEGLIVGWGALSGVSNRCVYAGVAENSVYVRNGFHGQGLGKKLLGELIRIAEANNIWTIECRIFPENIGSLKLHENLGFRIIGNREKLAKLDEVWRDVLLLERRSKVVG